MSRPSMPRSAQLTAILGLTALACVALLGAIPAASSGPAVVDREARSHEPATRLDTLADAVVLVTGSTGGLGREVARRVAGRGAHVIVHGRDRERGAALVAEIEADTPGSARFYPADLSSFDEVRELAAAVRRDYDRLDVLVNNAGIWLDGPRRESDDGHELHFQVNYLSGFLLTHLLLPLLEETAERSEEPVRIANVSSVAQQPIDFDDVMLESGYDDGRAYAQSKLAQIIFTFDLAERLEGTNLLVNAVHPASLMDTGMVLERGIQPRSSVDEGADAVMQLVVGEGIGSGSYFRGLEKAEANDQAYDARARSRLRELSAELTDLGAG